MSRTVINPHLRGVRRIFTDEELEIVDRFDVKKEIEDCYKSWAEYFHLPLPPIKRMGNDSYALTQTLMQVYGFPEELAESYATFQKRMIWKEWRMEAGFSPYHVMIGHKYKLPDDVVERIVRGNLEIDQALMDVYNLSSSTAYHVARNRISIDGALSGKDLPKFTQLGVLHSLFKAMRKQS
jgi:hypothetical protein